MKIAKYLIISFCCLNLSVLLAQTDSFVKLNTEYPVRRLTIEPAIGLNPWPMSDLVISNLVQLAINEELSIVSHTAYSYNGVFLRDFNYIKTNYNYTLSQKFGIGTALNSEYSSHTFSLLAGVKYDAFKETLENPEFETVSASVTSISPDFGLMYNLKKGKKKFFFSYRTYLPLYPYPVKSSDIFSIDGNLANISMEFGLGIRLK